MTDSVTELTDSDEVTINVEPVANAGSDQIVVVDNTVSFDGSDSIGTNLSYSWAFGDDATPATAISTSPQTSCTYSMTGTKTVTLTVTQGTGDQSRSDTDTLTVTVTSNEPRGVNNIEREALIYTFGAAVGEELAGLIEIRFDEDVEAQVPNTVNGKRISAASSSIQLIIATVAFGLVFLSMKQHISGSEIQNYTWEEPTGITPILLTNSIPLFQP